MTIIGYVNREGRRRMVVIVGPHDDVDDDRVAMALGRDRNAERHYFYSRQQRRRGQG